MLQSLQSKSIMSSEAIIFFLYSEATATLKSEKQDADDARQQSEQHSNATGAKIAPRGDYPDVRDRYETDHVANTNLHYLSKHSKMSGTNLSVPAEARSIGLDFASAHRDSFSCRMVRAAALLRRADAARRLGT